MRLRCGSFLLSMWLGLSVFGPGVAQAQSAELRAEILFEEGLKLASEGRFEAAELFFERSLVIAPTASAWLELALARLRGGKLRAALDALDALSELSAHQRLVLVPWQSPDPELAPIPWSTD